MATEPTIIMVDPAKITPYAKNAKKHTAKQIEKLAGLIAAFGFDQPILIDSDGIIVKGHGRREAAIRLGLKEVPCIVSELDEYQNMANRMADNAVVSLEYDEDMLKFDLGTLARQDFDLQLTGFDTGKLETLMADLDPGAGLPAPPRPSRPHGGDDGEPEPEPGEVTIIDGADADEPAEGEEPVEEWPGDVGRGAAPQPVVQYNLIFDNEAQQKRWYTFAKWLKETYDGDTLAARLDAYLTKEFEAEPE